MCKTSINIRPSVMAFAAQMETVLRENDYKGGWAEMTMPELIRCIGLEFVELVDVDRNDEFYKESLVNEAVDIANFCHMIFDNLTPESPSTPEC